MNNSSFINAPIKYITNLSLISLDGNDIIIEPGAARNSNNTNDIILTAPLTVQTNIVGKNGWDVAVPTGTNAPAVYIIGDSTQYNPTAGLLSLNHDIPVLPPNYDMYRKIGTISLVGSIFVNAADQLGLESTRSLLFTGPAPIDTGFNLTNFTQVDLSDYCNPGKGLAYLNVLYTSSAPGNSCAFQVVGGGNPVGTVTISNGAAASVWHQIAVNYRVGEIDVKVSTGDTLDIYLSGFTEYL